MSEQWTDTQVEDEQVTTSETEPAAEAESQAEVELVDAPTDEGGADDEPAQAPAEPADSVTDEASDPATGEVPAEADEDVDPAEAFKTELRKVVRPTRSELLTYTSVVLVFVTAVMAFVSVLDYGFGHLVLLVFGGGS